MTGRLLSKRITQWSDGLLLVFGVIIIVVLLAGVVDFVRRTQSTFVLTSTRQPGVVFTGEFSRVHSGLDLLNKGAVSSLLISGANPLAGIRTFEFVNQFQLNCALQAAMANGQLVLGPFANSTIENAAEARWWIASNTTGNAVVLITSRIHMPRASVALEHAIGSRVVLRYPVANESMSFSELAAEFFKYIATVVLCLI